MAENDLPHIVNLAKYRLGTENIEEDFEARYLYQALSPHFSRAERDVVSRFASTFRPEWIPPREQFSKWHYFVISPSQDERYYHYDKPVVILMGLPSGGGSGCRQDYRLSNTGIGIRLSRMASFQPNGKLYDGNGIQPDIVVELIPTDFIGRTDTVLDKATHFIKTKNNSLHL